MHKETYFTSGTIREKSLEMMDALVDFRRRHDQVVFDPRRAAVLVLDMQEYFLQENSHAFIPSGPWIIPNIQLLIDSFCTSQRPVIFTRHMNTPANAGMMSRWWKDLIRSDTSQSQLSSSLDPSKGVLLHKTQYDAFYDSDLETVLRANNIEQVVITGVMTHLCCESTARSAFVRGFEVLFVVDATATYNESLHCASLQNLAHGFAVPVLTEELIHGFE